MVATPDPKYHTEGEISHPRIARIAGIGLLIAISGTSQALGASGELRVEAGGNPDFLDPALARDPLAWQIMGATQGGLVAFRRAEGTPGTTVVPDLATALPVVSPNGLTLTFTLRDNVRFGPPASRVALPSDVKSSLEGCRPIMTSAACCGSTRWKRLCVMQGPACSRCGRNTFVTRRQRWRQVALACVCRLQCALTSPCLRSRGQQKS